MNENTGGKPIRPAKDDVPILTRYRTVQELVFERFRDQILSGELRPGDKLVERDLAQSLGVSRTPVREALHRLERYGLLEYRPLYGLTVASVSISDIVEVYRVRGALEGLAGAVACKNMSQAELQVLHELLDKMRQTTEAGDLDRMADLNTQFHDHINHAAHMPFLNHLLEQVRQKVIQFRALSLTTQRLPAEALAEHVTIVETLEARDAEKVESLLKQHSLNAVAALVEKANRADHNAAKTASRG